VTTSPPAWQPTTVTGHSAVVGIVAGAELDDEPTLIVEGTAEGDAA
jgi:hypothetical protein